MTNIGSPVDLQVAGKRTKSCDGRRGSSWSSTIKPRAFLCEWRFQLQEGCSIIKGYTRDPFALGFELARGNLLQKDSIGLLEDRVGDLDLIGNEALGFLRLGLFCFVLLSANGLSRCDFAVDTGLKFFTQDHSKRRLQL